MKEQAQELVSIVTPTYNCENFIQETIDSVINQSYENWELILVDDCSNDNTIEILNLYQKNDSRIVLIQLARNEGAAKARNVAIEKASGRYIAFIDSDDLWLPQKLELQIAFMREHEIALSYSSYQKIYEDGTNTNLTIQAKPKLDYQTMLRNNYIGCLTAIYDTGQIGKVYMPSIRKRQDWALWLKILKKTEYAYGINEPLAKYRLRNESISSAKVNLIKFNWKIYREIEGFSRLMSLYYMLQFLLFYFIKKKVKPL
jgi:glycosyltransferase involved in cell wall biosynthesis